MKKNKTKIISRRDFLKLAGLTAGGVTAGHFLFSELMAVPEQLLEKVARSTGKESWVNTICRQCPGGCGISIRRIDGIPVYVKGNPIFPVNRGGVCPMAHTSLEVLFNPDRVSNPLRRTGKKGQGHWEDIEWEEALDTLSQHLRDLVNKGEGDKIAIINGDSSPLIKRLCQHWINTVGSPNYFEDEGLLQNSIAVQLSQGIQKIPAYDFTNSKYILNFGSNFLEEGLSPVHYQNIFSHFRSGKVEASTTLVSIDSRINLTVSNSNRWIPIYPGTYGALALGIANVLIVNDLYDKEFVRKQCSGFDSFHDAKGYDHIGFESYVRANYYPEKVSEITGVPTQTIIKLGEEFGTHKPAIAISGEASRFTTNGSFAQWSVYCLNALIGNIQKKGGIFFTPPSAELTFPDIKGESNRNTSPLSTKIGSEVGATSLFGDITIDQFAEALITEDSDKIDTLLIIDSNPVFHSRNKETMIKALHTVKNVIYLGIFINETAKHCDLILPDHSYLEKMDISGPLPGLTFSHVGFQRPVIKPIFNTKQSGDILINLGKAVMGTESFPWKDYKTAVRSWFEALYKSGDGTIISKYSDKEWIKYLQERGWKLHQYESFKSFLKLLTKNGGWWKPGDSLLPNKKIYQTESSKFEFFSSTLQKRLLQLSAQMEGTSSLEKQERLLSNLNISARGDELFLPHYEKTITPNNLNEFPLILTVSQLLTNREGKGASQPSLMEMVGIQVGRYWKSWIEINPKTAAEYQLNDRDLVWVESSSGRVKTEVRLFQGIRPGVVHMALGLGHTSYGQFGTGIGANATDLIENNFDFVSNTPALNGTRVKISSVRMDT